MNTVNYLKEKNYNGINDIKLIVKDFHKKKITVSYENETKEEKRRVIFTCSKSLRNYTFDILCSECNGLILEASTEGWNILVMPILSPKSNINTNKINNWLAEDLYNIYAMEDGTVINLYYYENEWVISTARGIYMNKVKFNTLTYQEMLEECVEKVYDVKTFYKNLDTSSCYTIGFKHPDLHPFQEGSKTPIYKIWSIQSIDVKSLTKPMRKPIMEKFPVQRKYQFKTKNMHNLYKRLSSALQDYLEGKRPNYGYIMVSKNPNITHEFSIIMLESFLMSTIRNLWYNSAYIEFSKAKEYTKQNVILLNSFLDDNRTNTFTALFPKYISEFNIYKKNEDKLIEDIYDNIKNNTNESLNIVVQSLLEEVKNTINIELHDNPLQKIKDIIHNTKYFDHYYKYLFNNASA